jgi:hypothetical protein
MKTVIHVNMHVIKKNAKTGANEPPLTARTYKEILRGHTIDILDEHGKVVARIVNRPHKPLSCGARVWIETYEDVVVYLEDE